MRDSIMPRSKSRASPMLSLQIGWLISGSAVLGIPRPSASACISRKAATHICRTSSVLSPTSSDSFNVSTAVGSHRSATSSGELCPFFATTKQKGSVRETASAGNGGEWLECISKLECWRRRDKRARRLHTTRHPGPRLQASGFRHCSALMPTHRPPSLTGIGSEMTIPPLPFRDSWLGCTLRIPAVSDEPNDKCNFHSL